MNSGDLNREILLQSPNAGQDQFGQPVTTWTDFATVRAAINDASGRQFASAQAEQNAVYTAITIRYLPGVTASMRVVHGTDVYDIEAVLGQDRVALTLMCVRGKDGASGYIGGTGGQGVTTGSIGALIAGAVEKSVPVDTDSIGLSDSAESNIIKKFTWASLKSALNGIFARLAGIAGGQTLIGGTTSVDQLGLQGDVSGASPEVKIKNGAVAIGRNATPGIAVYGSGPSTTTTNLTVASSITDNLTERSAVAFQTDLTPAQDHTKFSEGLINIFAVPASNTFNIGSAYPFYNITEVRGSGNATGVYNSSNVANWYSSGNITNLYSVQGIVRHRGSGVVSVLQPVIGQAETISGGTTTKAWGTEGYIKLAAASSVGTAIGVGSGLSNAAGCTITDYYGVSVGGPNEVWSSPGSITNCYGVYIGSATNVGTNRWSLYNASPALSSFSGSIAVGVTAASAKLHALATTEQLRLGYDASNYASYTVSSTGALTITTTGTAPALMLSGDVRFDKTVTAAGTTGAQTINKTIGSVNFAAAASSLVVTNNKVTTSSVIVATVGTNDSTLKSVAVVAAAGSFTLYANAAATAETRVNFHVFN